MREMSAKAPDAMGRSASEAAELVPVLAAMIGELAAQVDVLTGLVKGQDSEGSWMSQDLSRLSRPSRNGVHLASP